MVVSKTYQLATGLWCSHVILHITVLNTAESHLAETGKPIAWQNSKTFGEAEELYILASRDMRHDEKRSMLVHCSTHLLGGSVRGFHSFPLTVSKLSTPSLLSSVKDEEIQVEYAGGRTFKFLDSGCHRTQYHLRAHRQDLASHAHTIPNHSFPVYSSY